MNPYREELPPGCPPADAREIAEGTVVYRLVQAAPPTDADFRSWRAMNEDTPLPNGISECRARSVSVFSSRTVATRLGRTARKFRGKRVCELDLHAGAGSMAETGRPAHRSWWPLAAYDILGVCKVLP